MLKLFPRVRSGIYLGHVNFFRSRLLTQDNDRIVTTIDRMEKEANAIRADVLKLCWYMRGGLTYSDAMNLSPNERGLIGGLIKENLDTTKKTGLPHF